ncbi:MAG: glycosyltransferase [Corallococcus sp.]|nr:glycosyltransferase [Corallococcus sp.]
MSKTVCILLSTYNGEKYLRPLLDSALAQDTQNGELSISMFVRDDGSKDGTVDILKEYAEKGLLTLADYGKENMGFAKSFSWLIFNAPQSDYYAFCDQDDIWLPQKISNAVNALEKEDASLPLLYNTNLIVVNKDLKELTRETHLHQSRNSPTQFEENVLQNNTYGCTIVINDTLRQLYRRVPENEVRAHDYLLTVMATGLGKYIFEENPQLLYRQHQNNAIGFYKGSLRNIIRSAKFVFEYDLKNSKLQNVIICKQCFYDMFSPEKQRFLDLLINYRTDKQAKKELVRFIKKEIKNKFIRFYSVFLIKRNKF